MKLDREVKSHMKVKKLVDLAKTIRSKNAGPDKITFDIIFKDKENYELVKRSQAITRRLLSSTRSLRKGFLTSSNSIQPTPLNLLFIELYQVVAQAKRIFLAASSIPRS